jgi:hypothetical protein
VNAGDTQNEPVAVTAWQRHMWCGPFMCCWALDTAVMVRLWKHLKGAVVDWLSVSCVCRRLCVLLGCWQQHICHPR